MGAGTPSVWVTVSLLVILFLFCFCLCVGFHLSVLFMFLFVVLFWFGFFWSPSLIMCMTYFQDLVTADFLVSVTHNKANY